ncbi:aromatic acid exporter family protein [Haloimpatiens sp. FM7315]|uniref:aromatic acid exporter family protein n=1 Tax=Haloimpatiens sp. FM7315 TaxID=3298609 RepID=UPI0035A2C3E0
MSKIGMRNLKTALSVFLCIVTLHVMKMPYPFYACIAAVICMQSSVFNSFKVGKNRMIGTSIGALIGLILALLSPESSILTGIGIIIVIYLCNLLNKKNSITIGCIVFLAIMTNLKGQDPFKYSTTRLLETFVGIAIAVIVNYLVFPPNYLNQIYSDCKSLIHDMFLISKTAVESPENVNIEKLEKRITNLESSLNLYLNEFRLKKSDNTEVETITTLLKICNEAYTHLITIKHLSSSCNLDKNVSAKYKELFNETISIPPKSLESSLDIAFNYHVHELLNLLYRIKEFNIDGLNEGN